MATQAEKGSILLEAVVFFYIVTVILLFLTKSENTFKKNKYSSSKFTHTEKLKELQDTQIKSLKEYEVR